MFANATRNKPVSDITVGDVNSFLANRVVSTTTLNNDRRALSSFFAWCLEQGWLASNPAQKKRRRGRRADENGHTPTILSVSEVEALLRAAEQYRDGLLAPYVAAAVFGGLRPFELRRLKWDQVNLTDGEIRLDGSQTKTGRPRTIGIHPTLAKWLKAHHGKPFYPPNWTRHFDAVKQVAGFRGRIAGGNASLKAWAVDVLRHTAISHYFRLTGSYGQTAEQFGNSEAIIKASYQGRVSTADTKAFYALNPTR